MDVKNKHKFIYWTPRIVSIIFILFLTLFSFDVFEGPFEWIMLLTFLGHSIPSIVLGVVLYFSWKKEIVGAIAFSIAGLIYILLILINIIKNHGEWYMLAWVVQISGPAFLIAYLFWKNHDLRKKG